MSTPPTFTIEPRPIWKYLGALLPVFVIYIILIGGIFLLMRSKQKLTEENDEALIIEWLSESRNFRKTLPELAIEYRAAIAKQDTPETAKLREAIDLQMKALAEPTRIYLNQIPGFPIIHRLSVHIVGNESATEVKWENPLPQPRSGSNSTQSVKLLSRAKDRPTVEIRCVYQLHALNREQEKNNQRFQDDVYFAVVFSIITALSAFFVIQLLRAERQRDLARLTTLAEVEHRERELLETRVQQQRAELEAAQQQRRADDAEKTALEMKSQLFAGIGIMAGSYAHNIKNLLVRPNDLLSRCLEADGLPPAQTKMLGEVKTTLGTVTERLQQILRTIRRDPGKNELGQFDLAELLQDTAHTWRDLAAEKWKVSLVVHAVNAPVLIQGDRSHLQQAIENLVFNARDAIFEERNARRDAVRREHATDADARKRKLIDTASWRGEVQLTLRAGEDAITLDISDNGIGMTPEVRDNCLKTHFSTKRDNAMYEGNAAGMGLGLSFVAAVLEHHEATLNITSTLRLGTTFQIRFVRPQATSA